MACLQRRQWGHALFSTTIWLGQGKGSRHTDLHPFVYTHGACSWPSTVSTHAASACAEVHFTSITSKSSAASVPLGGQVCLQPDCWRPASGVPRPCQEPSASLPQDFQTCAGSLPNNFTSLTRARRVPRACQKLSGRACQEPAQQPDNEPTEGLACP